MAATENVRILKVDTQEAVKNVNDLKENIKLLKEKLGDLTIGERDYQETLKELHVNQNALKDAMYGTSASIEDVAASAKGLNVVFDENNQLINQGNQSYNALVHTMAELKQEWRATTDEAKRAELGEQINQINQQLKSMDASVGNFQRNVGNYSSALAGLKEGFLATAGGAGKVINPIKNVTMGLNALSATPVIGILGLLANILTRVIDNLDSSEENTNRLTLAFAPLKAGTTLVTKAFQFLGEKLADVSEWFTKVLDKFGLISEEGKKHQEIVEEEISLVQKRREVEMANADAQLEIAKLKAQAAEKDKYTASERLQFIEAAAQKEKEIAERNIELARREYAVLQEKSKLAGNSKEENDKLAQAYVTLQKAETDYFNKTKELNAQRVEAINAIKAEAKATEELVEKKLELADVDKALKEGEARRMEALKLREEEEKAIAEDIEATWEETNAEIDAWFEEEDRRRREDVEATKKAEDEKAKAKISTLQAVASATSGILSTIADMMEADEKNSEKNAKKIKALRIASATIEMLQGAVGAFAQASATIPPPYGQIIGAASAASVVAMGIANIAKIKSTNPGSGGSSAAPASVSAPSVDTNMTSVRNVTTASEEDRLNRIASPQKVYILQSDIEAAGSQSKAQIEESSF
jgi:chromosome segregation ATPase